MGILFEQNNFYGLKDQYRGPVWVRIIYIEIKAPHSG